jgi:hypothetical protein
MFDYLLRKLGLRKEKGQVYCQECGRDITNEGGDVTSSGIYCHGDKPDGMPRCAVQALARSVFETGSTACMVSNTYSPGEVQAMIARGELKEFGLLERTAKR